MIQVEVKPMREKPNGVENGVRYVNLPCDLMADKRVPHSAFVVYGVMASKCVEGIEVEVSQGELADLVGVSRSCVMRGLKALEEAGHVKVTGGRGKMKRYRLVAFEEGGEE